MLSRRTFLKLSGMSLAAYTLWRWDGWRAVQPPPLPAGRTVGAVPLYNRPNGKITGYHFPDRVVTLGKARGEWIAVEDGYVAKTAVQPMPTWKQESALPARFPARMEIVAPIAVIRAEANALSAVVARVAHASQMQAVDHLPGTHGGWIALADNKGALLGWSQAVAWRVADNISP
ncbi:MAG: hypothetical protein SF123_18590 [Chloroflexota bacterium]|nr:hypothetical protein [Chloroflexota bacterium]